MTPQFALTAAVLDTTDPGGLARFHQRPLGWPLTAEDPDWASVRPEGGGAGLSFHLAPDHIRPAWHAGAGEPQMQVHLDIEVDDLAGGTAHALAAGAQLADFQPQDDVRVCVDPAGHPFCLWIRG